MPSLVTVNWTLNNTYSEKLEDATTTTLFTDASRTAVADDIFKTICTSIIDLIVPNGQADCSTVAPIVNHMAIYRYCGKSERQYPLRSPTNLATALTQTVNLKKYFLVIYLSTSTLFIDTNTYNPYDFTGFSTT